jgi:protease I
MANELQGRKIAFLATDGVEQVELSEPRKAVEEAGAETHLISLQPGELQGYDHLDKGDTFQVDKAVAEADPSEYDALVLPGGVANPDSLRMDRDAVRFVRQFFDTGKPVGAICHAPWMLVEADVVRGRTLTSWPSLQTDIRNAGGDWVDQEVVVDQGLVTSRNPGDIPAFNAKLIEEFAEGRHEGQRPEPAAVSTMATSDAVQEASEESMVASDPPAWTSSSS